MNCKAISSVVSAILILALITLSASVIWANYVPFENRNAEIELNEELEEEFLKFSVLYSELKENETKNLLLKLGGKKTFVGILTTTSTLKLNKTGNFSINMECENSSFTKNYTLFSLELFIHNNFLPEKRLVFSEGGLKIFQVNRNFTKIEPRIEEYLNYDPNNRTIYITIDNLTTEPYEISGSGFSYLKFKYRMETEFHTNCTGYLQVNDTIFEMEWVEKMRELSGLIFEEDKLRITFTNINASISIKDFKIALI